MNNTVLQRQKVWRITLLFLLLGAAGLAKGYAQSTMGTDFWVSFLPNHDGDEIALSLIATGARACSGTVSNPNTNWSKSFTVSVGNTTVITIPKAQAYSQDATDRVVNTGLHVISTDTISLYASNFKKYTFDVTDVLPTESLGTEYLVQNYPPTDKGVSFSMSHEGGERSPGDCTEFIIVASEDNTRVRINLTCNSENGHYANQPFTVTLDAGQCYQLKSVMHANLTGSQISCLNDKKVAVFAGNTCANIPSDSYCCCDHIVEQMMPVSSLGQKFVITNSMMRSKDAVCVTALNDNCQIRKNGTLLTTINARQTYKFEITSSAPSMYLETSEPAMVYLYYVGSDYGGLNGDPSMVIISPIEQKINRVTFSTFNSGASQYHYINVVVDSDKVAGMELDGSSIASRFQVVAGNSDYSYARIQVNHGSHTLSNSKGGFVAHVYGLGEYESYAYSVGSMAKNLTSQLLVDNQAAADYPNGFDVCGTDPVVFNLDLNYGYSRVHWDFGDGQEGDVCPITHAFDNSGDYEVSCDVYIDGHGGETLVSTLTTTIHAHSNYSMESFASHCDSYTWLGQNYTQSGDYERLYHTDFGCDSLLTLHLTIEHIESHIQENGCDAYEWFGTTYTTSGQYQHLLQTQLGCDSLIVMDLDMHTTETTHESSVSCDQFEWRGEVYTESGTYEHFEGQTIHGCDSICYLDLTIHRTPQVEILGYSQVAYSSNQWPGIYHYYVVDSTLLEPGSIIWSFSNPDWIFVPVSDYHCMIIAKSEGEAMLSVETNTTVGCNTSASLEINATGFGVDEEEGMDILLFPNPAQTEVTVSAPEMSRVVLRNALGQTVLDLPVERTDQATIGIENLSQGLYIVEITTVFGKTAKQLVISR